MGSIIRFMTLAPAVVVFIAACVTQTTPAASRTVCGDRPVQAFVQARTEDGARYAAWVLWRNCAIDAYGYEWGDFRVARNRRRMDCNDVGPRPRYRFRGWRDRRQRYMSHRRVTCWGRDVWDAEWVCYLRATPCRAY